MDADRWRQIETLYEAAQARAADERAAFLMEACAGDEALRRAVESLLAYGHSADQILNRSADVSAGAMPAPATPTSGWRATPATPAVDLTGMTIGRFSIHERLGHGGMAEVYRAYDRRLKRPVAIKRVAPDRQRDSPSTEVLKEAQRAGRLNHAHIMSVYDVLPMGDELLLVMEFVDGVTLRERLATSVTLPEFLAIAVQCVDALAAAHQNGILHGDIKPANIMLTRGLEVKVCDFGLARRLWTPEASVDSTVTVSQRLAGTPAYIAPEVVLQQPVEARADLFSLGVVFYEMLAGRNPFIARGAVATIDRILNHAPEPLDRVAPSVPGPLARLVERMLEKDPRHRPAGAAEVRDALTAIGNTHVAGERRRRRLSRGASWAALAAAATFVVFTVPRLPDSTAAKVSMPEAVNLAVLPFTADGTGGDRQYFTDGLTEALNEQLSRLTENPRFQVATVADRRARNVTTPSEAREQLGSNVALTGSLRYEGDEVQVTSVLLDTRSGQRLRASTFTAAASNPLAVEARVVDAVLGMLDIDFGPERQKIVSVTTTPQPGAYDYYLQARGYLLNYDRAESIDSAIAVFRKALEVDPRYAPAYAGVGQAYWRKQELTGAASWAEPARAACEGALGLDPNLAESHICLGMVLNGTGAYERAAAAYSRALDREPTNDLAYLGLATAYERLGRPAEAEQTYRRAIDLRPHYWAAYNNLGAYYYRQGRFDEALAMFEQAVTLAPDSFRGYSSVGATQFMRDRVPEAIAAFQRSLAIRPNSAAASNLGTLYFYEGQFQRAADLFRQALSFDQSSYQVWGNLAQTLVQTGERQEAAMAFRRARELALERLEVNSRDAALHMGVAEFSAALGEMDRARLAFSDALALSPEDAHTLYQIGVFYEVRLKRRDEALEWLAKAVARGQTWREIDRTPELRELRADPRFETFRRAR